MATVENPLSNNGAIVGIEMAETAAGFESTDTTPDIAAVIEQGNQRPASAVADGPHPASFTEALQFAVTLTAVLGCCIWTYLATSGAVPSLDIFNTTVADNSTFPTASDSFAVDILRRSCTYVDAPALEAAFSSIGSVTRGYSTQICLPLYAPLLP